MLSISRRGVSSARATLLVGLLGLTLGGGFSMLGLPGCGGEEGDGLGPGVLAEVSQEVGPAGGTVSIPGVVEIMIPAGALDENVEIGVTVMVRDDYPDAGSLESDVIQFSPSGLVFNKDVTVSILRSDGASFGSARVAQLLDDQWVELELSYDFGDSVRAKLAHFSTYANHLSGAPVNVCESTGSSYDEDCDGTPDSCTSYSYDASGFAISSATDSGCTGSIDSCTHYFFDGNGFVSTTEYDWECDGVPDRCDAQTNDATGNPLSFESDTGCDGEPEFCLTSTYVGDLRVSSEYDELCDGSLDSCNTPTYDGEGNLVSSQDDVGCDGSPDVCFTFTVDGAGNVLTIAADDGCDGSDENCYTSEYDANGNEISSTYDAGCDGAADQCTSSDFECPAT